MVQLAVIDSSLDRPAGEPGRRRPLHRRGVRHRRLVGRGRQRCRLHRRKLAVPDAGRGLARLRRGGATLLVYEASGWEAASGHVDSVTELGINATADATNRLSVRSDAVLFSNIDAGSGGTGDVRFVVNKETAADTASLLFQTGFSGRAEVGLAGDDDFVFKVSPDGSAWAEAIRIDKDTGLATILYDNATSGLAATNVQDAIDEVAASGGGGGGGAVSSVFGRTGAVAAAASDYDASEVGNNSGVSGATVAAALDTLDGGKQDADADLTAIAALAPSNDDVIQRKAGAWTNRTPAQLKTDLSLAKGDVGLGNVDNTADADKPISDATQSALDAKQDLDATLTSLAALGTAADKVAYTTGVDTWAEAAVTAAGRAILDDADAAAQRATLGVAIGSDVQAYSANLDDWSGEAVADYANLVESDAASSGVTGADAITNIVSCTQAEYDAGTPDSATIYIITDA